MDRLKCSNTDTSLQSKYRLLIFEKKLSNKDDQEVLPCGTTDSKRYHVNHRTCVKAENWFQFISNQYEHAVTIYFENWFQFISNMNMLWLILKIGFGYVNN